MPAEKNSPSFFQVAIDGPVAAGKGTVAKNLAEKLGFLYIDTGAMYRCGALLAAREQLEPTVENEEQIVALLKKADLRLDTDDTPSPYLTRVSLDGEDVSEFIRSHEINLLVPAIAALPQVRQVLVEKQQAIAASHNVVMEGRDITYRVLPAAQLKVFLTADSKVRAERRQEQQALRGETQDLASVYEELLERDQLDSSRATDPLKIVPEALIVDTTYLSINAVVALLADRVRVLRG
jgi:cytidylate kinase